MTPATFRLNGDIWRVVSVDPRDDVLVDRTGRRTVAVTDPSCLTIFMASSLGGPFFTRVLIHELAHAATISYGLLEQIHALVPRPNWIEMEEWICNFIADYGYAIFSAAYRVLGDTAWLYLPQEFERMIA